MATLERKANSFRVRVTLPSGRRVPITLGDLTKQMAETIRRHIHELESSKLSGVEPRAATRGWLLDVGDELHERIARLGLVPSRTAAREAAALKTVGDAIDKFFLTSNTVPQTVLAYRQGTEQLANHFTRLRALETIGVAEADDYVAIIRKSGLARATQSKRLQVVKRLFGRCTRWGWLKTNPFDHIRPGGQTNPERVHYLPADYIERLIGHVADPEWKAIIALARYGGLRCPSEVLAVKWEDIDFDAGRMKVISSKTAKAGKPFRHIPLFAELRPYLEAIRPPAAAAGSHVVTRYRQTNANLRTQLDRWIGQAGLKAYPKPFQNMRASRATEVQKLFGPKAAADWLGHTETVAMHHYWQTTDSDFTRAVSLGATPSVAGGQKGGQTLGEMGGLERTLNQPNPHFQLENGVFREGESFSTPLEWALQDSNL